jgi:hypothetical protein
MADPIAVHLLERIPGAKQRDEYDETPIYRTRCDGHSNATGVFVGTTLATFGPRACPRCTTIYAAEKAALS